MSFDDLKQYDGKLYTGMPVGMSHHWTYPNGTWKEEKISPDRWRFDFRSMKTRHREAPPGTGAKEGSRYHWFIVADQRSVKIDKDSYETHMQGYKFKIGHRRPFWKKWSYQYPEQDPYDVRVREALETILDEGS